MVLIADGNAQGRVDGNDDRFIDGSTDDIVDGEDSATLAIIIHHFYVQ